LRKPQKGPHAICEEYPQNLGVYETLPQSASDPDGGATDDRTLIFFLGAVRDMSPEETAVVHRSCKANRVPCVEANLGHQAEFTSKIIDILHGHHLHRRLAPAIWRRARSAIVSSPAGGALGRSDRAQRGKLWVFVPVGGGPGDLAADDRKRDGMYEVPRCCISQLWCSKSEHSGHMLSFVFTGGDVLTVSPKLVTCLKLQHRAAPTERNLVNALRVGMGDRQADISLTIDEGCVSLGDVTRLRRVAGDRPLDPTRTALVDLQFGGDAALARRLDAYAAVASSVRGPQDIVLLARQADGRDFPRGFRERLSEALFGTGAPTEGKRQQQVLGALPVDVKSPHQVPGPRWLHVSLPQMSIHGGISLVAHYWHANALAPALAAARGSTLAGSGPAGIGDAKAIEGSTPAGSGPTGTGDAKAIESASASVPTGAGTAAGSLAAKERESTSAAAADASEGSARQRAGGPSGPRSGAVRILTAALRPLEGSASGGKGAANRSITGKSGPVDGKVAGDDASAKTVGGPSSYLKAASTTSPRKACTGEERSASAQGPRRTAAAAAAAAGSSPKAEVSSKASPAGPGSPNNRPLAAPLAAAAGVNGKVAIFFPGDDVKEANEDFVINLGSGEIPEHWEDVVR